MAITVTLIGTGPEQAAAGGTNATATVTSTSATWVAGDYVLVALGVHHNFGTDWVGVSLSSSGGALGAADIEVTSPNLAMGGYKSGASFLLAQVTTGFTGTISASRTAGSADHWLTGTFYKLTGVSGTIVQAKTNSQAAGTNTLALNLTSAPASTSLLVALLICNSNDAWSTLAGFTETERAETGWLADHSVQYINGSAAQNNTFTNASNTGGIAGIIIEIADAGGGGGGTPDKMLLEDGFSILLEDGFVLDLESTSSGATVANVPGVKYGNSPRITPPQSRAFFTPPHVAAPTFDAWANKVISTPARERVAGSGTLRTGVYVQPPASPNAFRLSSTPIVRITAPSAEFFTPPEVVAQTYPNVPPMVNVPAARQSLTAPNSGAFFTPPTGNSPEVFSAWANVLYQFSKPAFPLLTSADFNAIFVPVTVDAPPVAITRTAPAFQYPPLSRDRYMDGPYLAPSDLAIAAPRVNLADRAAYPPRLTGYIIDGPYLAPADLSIAAPRTPALLVPTPPIPASSTFFTPADTAAPAPIIAIRPAISTPAPQRIAPSLFIEGIDVGTAPTAYLTVRPIRGTQANRIIPESRAFLTPPVPPVTVVPFISLRAASRWQPLVPRAPWSLHIWGRIPGTPPPATNVPGCVHVAITWSQVGLAIATPIAAFTGLAYPLAALTLIEWPDTGVVISMPNVSLNITNC